MINKATVVSNAWQEIFDMMSNIGTIGSTVSVNWYGHFPDTEINTTTDYPVGIIETPEFEQNDISIGHKLAEMPISIDIDTFCTKTEHTDLLSNKMIDTIDNNKGTLLAQGLILQNVDRSSTTHLTRQGIDINHKNFTINLLYGFQRD